MELRHLRYFVVIAEERSFTRAAERLWVAQPGLSKQIRHLEAELGVALFERHSRGVDLTDAGELFMERARAALAAVEEAATTGRDSEAGLIGTVRVGLAMGASWRHAWRLLDQFATTRARVELSVVEAYPGNLSQQLADGHIDALIGPSGFEAEELRGVCRLELGAEPWVALVGSGHVLAGSGPLTASALHGKRVAVTGHRHASRYDQAVADLLDEFGVTAVLSKASPGPALQASVAKGDLVALTTAPAALHPEVLARSLNPRRSLRFRLFWREEAVSPALTELIRLAADCAQRRRGVGRPLAAVA